MKYDAVIQALRGDEGAYAGYVPAWLNFLCSYVDFGWFAALLGWTLVLLWWWNVSRRTASLAWRWLPWSAGAGFALAIVALADLAAARLGSSPREAYFAGDRAMTFLFLFTVSGWWIQAGWQSVRLGRAACLVAAGLPLPLLVWFLSLPPRASIELPAVGWLMLSLTLTAVVPWLWLRSADRWSRVAITLAGLAPLVSTVGPLARRILFMGERFSPVTPLACVSAAIQALIAWFALLGLIRTTLAGQTDAGRRALWREIRPFVAGATACVALGLLVACWIGERQNDSARERALDQASLAATQLDASVMAALVAPAFRLDQVWSGAQNYYPPTRLAFSQFLANGGEAAARQAFLPIAKASRTMLHLRFVTLRGGWLVGAVGFTAPVMGSMAGLFGSTSLDPASRPGRWSNGYVLLARRPSAEDLMAWAGKNEWLEGPLSTPVFSSPVIFARAPVVARDGRMLGWLEFTYAADAFLANAVQARIAPFMGAILGILLTALLFVQRRDARRGEAARLEAAVAAEANRAKTDFLAKVSHELRTPLQSLLGYGELIGRHVIDVSGQAHLSAQMQHGELMLRLVNDLLDLSAIEAGVFRFVLKPVAAADLVGEVTVSLRPAAEAKGLSLRWQVRPGTPPWVMADAQRLRQIVINLTGNAVKFTERGGVEVILSARLVGEAACRLELTVRDTGPGISAADQGKLFQPFSRLDGAAGLEGAGLGLTLTRALCRSAGGDLTVESDGRSGASFCATLMVQPCGPPPVSASTTLPAASLQDCRILVADDNILVRELFIAHLRELGAICETASDGEEALARARRGGLDVLIVDVSMPRLDGLEVTRRIRAAGDAALRIVGVSAHATAALGTRAREAGMQAFLTKPVKLAELTAALSDMPAGMSVDKKASIQAGLAELFRREVRAQIAGISAAVARSDWAALGVQVHYLKGSAGVLGDENLYLACEAIEAAVEEQSSRAVVDAWQRCLLELNRWES